MYIYRISYRLYFIAIQSGKNIECFLPAILEMKVIYSYMTNEVHNIMKE